MRLNQRFWEADVRRVSDLGKDTEATALFLLRSILHVINLEVRTWFYSINCDLKEIDEGRDTSYELVRIKLFNGGTNISDTEPKPC